MIDAFKDVTPPQDISSDGKINGLDYLDRVAGMQVGQGTRVMRVDESGIWLGAKTFALAPFSVDMDGNLIATSATIRGDIILGGAGNVNGTLSLLDASSVEQILLDNTGITINNGKLTIKDGTNTAIMDSTGLIGSTQFETQSVRDANTFNTTSSTYVDITNMSVVTSSFTRTIPAVCHIVANFRVDDTGDWEGTGSIGLNLDGSIPADSVSLTRDGYRSGTEQDGVLSSVSSTHYYSTPSTGTHTYKLQARVNPGVGTPFIEMYTKRITVTVLGK